jgi:predicted ATPase
MLYNIFLLPSRKYSVYFNSVSPDFLLLKGLMKASEIKIPVTIITGFLGAGKTTLLNHLIREYPVRKYAREK